MKKLDKRFKNTGNIVDFKEEQGVRLSSNNVSERCSSLDFTNEKSKDELLNELADIFVDSILREICNGKQQEKGSNILSGFN